MLRERQRSHLGRKLYSTIIDRAVNCFCIFWKVFIVSFSSHFTAIFLFVNIFIYYARMVRMRIDANYAFPPYLYVVRHHVYRCRKICRHAVNSSSLCVLFSNFVKILENLSRLNIGRHRCFKTWPIYRYNIVLFVAFVIVCIDTFQALCKFLCSLFTGHNFWLVFLLCWCCRWAFFCCEQINLFVILKILMVVLFSREFESRQFDFGYKSIGRLVDKSKIIFEIATKTIVGRIFAKYTYMQLE